MREPRVSSRSWFGECGGPVGAFPVLIAFSEQGVGLKGCNVKLIWLLKMLAIGRMTLDMGCGCDARARDCSVDDGNSSSPEQNKK